MAATIFPKTPTFLIPKTLTLTRLISTFPSLFQKPQLEDPPSSQDAEPHETSPSSSTSDLPPNPSLGSPFHQQNWRNPNPGPITSQSLVPIGRSKMMAFSQTMDLSSLMDVFADLMTSQKWSELKQLFECWIQCLDAHGKPNKPDVNLFNHYLRANLMMEATAAELLDLVAAMEDYQISPNTASYNLVLKAMHQADESEAAEKLIERMIQTGITPDDESYNLVIGLLISKNLDSALKFLDLILKSGNMLSSSVFMDCVRRCVNTGRLDTLSSIIEKCKTTDQNKALSPTWNMCNTMADVALQADNSKLAFYALEFLYRWIVRGENARPPILLSVDEGLVVSALSAAGRTYNSTLIDASWSILRRSLRQKRDPNPQSYLSKIYAYASLGNLQRAFATLNEWETVYGDSKDSDPELFSPFSSLYPLVVACCRNGFSTLDSVYVQLENLSRAETPYKSVAALNCVILGCANVWDLDRAYETFQAIEDKIGLTPDVHSYNALMCAFGKVRKTTEAASVFEHLVSKDVKPNATTYRLLAEVHLINRDPKAAISVLDQMIDAGFTPSKETLKKVRRRCSREIDFESDERVQSLAKKFGYRMPSEFRREMLYNLQYSAQY